VLNVVAELEIVPVRKNCSTRGKKKEAITAVNSRDVFEKFNQFTGL